MRSISLLAALLVVVATAAGVGCSTRNEDINRVVQPYWSKAYFNDGGEWYARSTVVDAPPEHGWVSIADGDWLMLDKLRWEITQDELIGWRTYSSAPGSENEQLPGGQDLYKGQAVARFKVTDHFDIQRSFDTTTGEQGNTIVENKDRLWFDREFFRVDWSKNLVETYRGYLNMNSPYGFNISSNERDGHIYGSNQPAQPKRWRFEADEDGRPTYFEITTRTEVEPDVAGLIGYYGVLSGDTSSAVIDVRQSFMRVPKSDYEALAMPPSVVLEDETGKEVRDARGFAVKIPINDRFGYFGTLGRATFDANRGMTTSGQVFNASRFNLWQKNRNDDGSLIPLADRSPKPEAIVYYMNVEHPLHLRDASLAVAAQWNKAFRDTVFNVNKARYTGALDKDGIPADVPAMFVVKDNDCNVANVERVLAGLADKHEDIVDAITKDAARVTVNNEVVPFDGSIASVKSRYLAANDGITNMQPTGLGPNGESFTAMQATETQALNDLERICSALEYYTADDLATGRQAPDDVTPFRYQRLGDTRYSMMNLLVGDFQSGWLGLGPPYADPITGETISATANIAVSLLDRQAARAAQFVQALNGEQSEFDFIQGIDLEAYTNQKLLENSKLITRRASQQTKDSLAETFSARGGQAEVMREVAPGRADQRFRRLVGTEAEQKLITNDDLALFGAVAPEDIGGITQTDALMNAASIVRNPTLRDLGGEAERRAIRMGQRAADSPEMIDSLMIGTAIAYKDMSYGERFKQLRQDIYKAVMLHEVGHNTGLFHNFAASTDAINYGPSFWAIQNLPADLDDAISALAGSGDEVSRQRVVALEHCLDVLTDAPANEGGFGDFEGQNLTTQECLRQSEGMYSSIMDYMGTWNADLNGLGAYDFAATKFAYGQLLEVFPEGNLAGVNAAGDIKDKLFYNDWRDIPELFTGGSNAEKVDQINAREYVSMDWNTSSTRHVPLKNEVPYRFGSGNYPEPQVRVYDFGPDTRTNAAYQLTRYYEHYFFSHFARNRLWDYDAINGPISSDAGIFDDFTQKMQWYFFYSATDPKFAGSYAEEDFLATTITGLNHFAHVLAEPSSGDFSTMPRYQLFGLTNLRPDERDTQPLNVALPWSSFDLCTAATVNETTNFGTVMGAAKPGYTAGQVPLGEGRPFFVGFTDDYVDFYIRHVGHFWAKQYALIYLADNAAWFPRVDGDADFRTFDVSWYRLFPKEVSSLFGSLITQNDIALGGFLDENGAYVRPDLIRAEGDNRDTSTMARVLPQIATNHNYYAYLLANIYMSSPTDDVLDLPKTMNIAVDGGSDDVRAFDDAEARDLAAGCVLADDPADPYDQFEDLINPPACKTTLSFTHPVTGMTFRALKVGDSPIAFDLIKRLNVLKERHARLQVCATQLENEEPVTDSYCNCLTNITTGRVENELQTVCTLEPVSIPPGESVTTPRAPGFGQGGVTLICDDVDLFNRLEGAREGLDDFVDYVNDLRTYNKLINNF